MTLSTFVALDKKTATGQNVKTGVFMVLTNTLHLLIKTGMVDNDLTPLEKVCVLLATIYPANRSDLKIFMSLHVLH